MDALGDSLENLGLAQEIQKGLSTGLQKPPKWAEMQGEIDALKAKYQGMAGWAVFNESKLAAGVITEWGNVKGFDLAMGRRRSSAGAAGAQTNPPTEAGVNANWADFCAGTGLDVLAKYTAYFQGTICKAPAEKKQFEEARALGRGAFGAVFLTFKKDTGSPMATKKMFKKNAKANKMLSDLLIEREVLGTINSRFAVSLHYAYESDIEVSLVLTLMPGGDLSFLLQSRYSEAKKKEDRKFTPLPESVVKFYAASMACGLQSIHDAGYVYRDLKPQNVLLDVEGKVRISDMGLTALVKDKKIKQCSGTRGYWSPETIAKTEYQYEPDWWSLGVTMYVLTSDKLPFKGKEDAEKDAATTAGVIEFDHGEPEGVKPIILDLCKVEQKARLGCTGGLSQVKAHPYFAGFNWFQLESGTMEAEIKPNPNDINAPDKSEIDGFKIDKTVEWETDDQARFKDWQFVNKEIWVHEALFRIKNKKELEGGGGGGGGCCTIS